MTTAVTPWYRLTNRYNESVAGNTAPWSCTIGSGDDSVCGGVSVSCSANLSAIAPVGGSAVLYTDRLLCTLADGADKPSIPPGNEINGVEVEIYKYSGSDLGSSPDIGDYKVLLLGMPTYIYGPTLIGDNRAKSGYWHHGMDAGYGAKSTYGSDSDTMGLVLDLASYTYAVGIEAFISQDSFPVSGSANVLCVRYRFWYSDTSGGGGGGGGSSLSLTIDNPADSSTISENIFTASWTATGGTPPIVYGYHLDSMAETITPSTSEIFSGVADGSRSLTVKAIDSIGNTANDSSNFTISNGGVPQPYTANFTATEGADRYAWTFGDGLTADGSSNTISHGYAMPGTYMATVTAFFGQCPWVSDVIQVQIDGFSTSFTMSPNGLDVTFTPKSANGIDPFSTRYYLFDFGDNNTNGYYYLQSGTGDEDPLSTFHHTFASPGQYEINVFAMEGGKVDNFIASSGQTDFNTSENYVLGTTVVLKGTTDDTLNLLTSGTDYYETSVYGTGITLSSPASDGDKIYVGYLTIHTPSYGLTATASNSLVLGDLNFSIDHASDTYCYSPDGVVASYSFTATMYNGTPPYTLDWYPDKDCIFGGSDSTDYTLRINNVITDCSTPITDSGIQSTTDSITGITYNPPSGERGADKTTYLGLKVQDSSSTPLSSTADITMQFYPLPVVPGPGTGEYYSRDYRFQSYYEPTPYDPTPIGPLYEIQTAPVIGIPAGSGQSYAWTPPDYLSSPVVSQPTCSLPYYPENIVQESYKACVIDDIDPYCINTNIFTVIKPRISISGVSEDVAWLEKEDCYRRVMLTISSLIPINDGLALVVERVAGDSGSVNDLGRDSTPKILDRAVNKPCDNYYQVGSSVGGICILDEQHRNLDGGNNRIAMRVPNSMTLPYHLYVLDPICSNEEYITHDYRIRVIDISGSTTNQVTEAAVISQLDEDSTPIYTVSASNDVTVEFSGVSDCSASLIINPQSTTYDVVGSPWTKSITLSLDAYGFTPSSYSWEYDKDNQFDNTQGYSYTVSNGTSAAPTVIYSYSGNSSNDIRVARVGLTCMGVTGGGENITVHAGDVYYTMGYTPGCSISCDDITATPGEGDVPLTVDFSASATTTDCGTSGVTYSWLFGDGDSGTGQTVSHTYTHSGNFSASVTVSSNDSPSVTCTKNISVIVHDTCTFSSCTATANGVTSLSVTAGDTVTLGGDCNISGAGCGEYSSVDYSWSCPGASPSSKSGTASLSGSSAAIPPSTTVTAGSASGSYDWVLKWSLDNGQTCSKTVNVTISGQCSCSITAASPSTGWANEVLAFSANVTPTDCSGNPEWLWDFGDDGATSSSINQNPTHAYSASGTYSWSVTASYDGVPICSKGGTITICGLTCSGIATQGTGNTINFHGSYTVEGGCSTTAATYSWDFGDNTSSSAQNPAHTYSSSGTYTWTLTVTVDGHACTDTGTITTAIVPGNITFSYEDDCPDHPLCWLSWSLSWTGGTGPFTVTAHLSGDVSGSATRNVSSGSSVTFTTNGDFGISTLCGSASGNMYMVISDSSSPSNTVTTNTLHWSHPAADPCS